MVLRPSLIRRGLNQRPARPASTSIQSLLGQWPRPTISVITESRFVRTFFWLWGRATVSTKPKVAPKPTSANGPKKALTKAPLKTRTKSKPRKTKEPPFGTEQLAKDAENQALITTVKVVSADNGKLESVKVQERARIKAVDHYDLASYERWVQQGNKSRTSPTYIGDKYEYQIKDFLEPYGFKLNKRGGAGDQGIDLIGTWYVPDAPWELKVIIQCKAGKTQSRPDHVRALIGAYHSGPATHRGNHSMAFLASTCKAGPGTIDVLTSSKSPMGYLWIDTEGRMNQCILNQAAISAGLGGLSTREVYVPTSRDYAIARVHRAVVFTWDDRPWPGVSEDYYLPAETQDKEPLTEDKPKDKPKRKPRHAKKAT